MSIYPQIYVYAYVGTEAVLAGTFINDRGVGTFRYHPSYLGRRGAYPLDPQNLPLGNDPFVTRQDDGIFGVFLDSHAQDWGLRVLSHLNGFLRGSRRFNIEQLAADRHLMMTEGSGYGTGCLRYDASAKATHLELEPAFTEAGWNSKTQIRRIAVVLGSVEDGKPLPARCQSLLVPGMSLGGARPKALVHIDGSPWIAKFSRKLESIDSPRVEFAVSTLARRAGIDIAEFDAETITGRRERTVYLSKRFDRTEQGVPRHFISAASLLGAPQSRAGHLNHSRYSYSSIADMIRRHSSRPLEDCAQLFRRMAFNVLVGNRDDHLGNHGFILDFDTKFRLSPAFDVALDPQYAHRAEQQIKVGVEGTASTIQNVLSNAPRFGLSFSEAAKVVWDLYLVVETWQELFTELNVRPPDINWVSRLIMSDGRKKILAAARQVGVHDFRPAEARRLKTVPTRRALA